MHPSCPYQEHGFKYCLGGLEGRMHFERAPLVKRVAILSLSPLQYDSRILRHAKILVDAGYEVRIFARGPLPDSVPCRVTKLPGPGNDWRVRAGIVLRQAPATIWPQTAPLLYWLSWTRLVARNALRQYVPDIIIANDWPTLPISANVKYHCNSRIIYDSHEFSSEEFSDNLPWRLLAQQHVSYIEKNYIVAADAILTVSKGISKSLFERYSLSEPPTVIFNMPPRHNIAFRPSHTPISVIYHGAIAPRRGLENLIKSVDTWPAHFRLELRGPVQGQFDLYLRTLARSLGERVVFRSAVPPSDLIETASQADIGIFLFTNTTTHAKFVLPNKIFEYIQAGLMVISSDLPEIRTLFEKIDCGILLSDNEPRSIAKALTNLTPQIIDKFKRASISASQTFNLENEQTKFLDAIRKLSDRS